MKIISNGINIEVTDPLKEQIQLAFGNIVESFDNLVVEDITVTLESHLNHKTDKHLVKARIPVKGNDIISEASGEDMYHAISEAASNATRQIRKLKGKLNNKGSESIRH